MQLVSTRNTHDSVSFRQALLNCMPPDGGLYVPYSEHDLRPWILHMNETTSFSAIAGSLTAALFKEEISPVVLESIAVKAFDSYSPRLRQLDDRLFLLELFHGPTGSHRDFGYLWLASALEHFLTLEEKKAIVIAPTTGIGGRSMANAFAHKKHLKLVLLYPKGMAAGLKPDQLYRNGGSVYLVEVEGSITDVENMVRSIYADSALVQAFNLTLANSINIGRVLPQTFFFMYAFMRLKKRTAGEIFYAIPSGNYSNLAAGLYAWKFCLPVNGFITDATDSLVCDADKGCLCGTATKPLAARSAADPAVPSNIERLEQLFTINPAVMRSLVFSAKVSDTEAADLISTSYQRYGIMFDRATARAYAAALAHRIPQYDGEESLVIVSKDHPAFESKSLQALCGDEPIMPDHLHGFNTPMHDLPLLKGSKEELIAILNRVSKT